MNSKLRWPVMLALFCLILQLQAQKVTLNGYVKDAENGEALIGANIVVKGTSTGAITNAYGYYSLSLKPGPYTILYSYVGFSESEKKLNLQADQTLSIELTPSAEMLNEVVVSSERQNSNIASSKMGLEKLDSKTINKIPVLFGEADVIKTLKLLPGVVSTGELSSNISIRGGGRDQNMLLLDEATVYNNSHLLGLFSVFNNDAIKNVQLYKGIIPAQYGGRLSSLIDVRMKEGNIKKFAGTGSIGILTSKLTLEAPVVKDKGAILLSGRRTYIDLFTRAMHKMAPEKIKNEIPFYFYDLNAKGNYIINDNNRLYLSGYFGRDVFNSNIGDDASIKTDWGNYTGTLRWNHIVNSSLFLNTSLIVSKYDYSIDNELTIGEGKEEVDIELLWVAWLKDYTMKADFGYFLNPQNTIKFGISGTYHDFNVGKVNSRIDTSHYQFQIPKSYCYEWSGYLSNEQKYENISLEYGVRASLFQNIGKAKYFTLENYEVIDTIEASKGKVYNQYWGLEPRFSASFILNSSNSIKFGYARTTQYIQVASNSESGNPLETWMPSGKNVKPQIADQVSLGYFMNLPNKSLETSVEFYYKYMQNQIEFKEFSQTYLNEFIDEEFRFGVGRAYGVEFMVKKNTGKINGWISYTLSRSERKIDDIQEKDWFLSPYDVTNNLTTVVNYDITKRLCLSANFIFTSGRPFNAPVARYEYNNMVLPYYGHKNASRYPAYHRLDFGLEWKNKPHKRYNSSWSLSVYNVYGQKNATVIYFDKKENSQYQTAAYRIALLPQMLSVAYNFNF